MLGHSKDQLFNCKIEIGDSDYTYLISSIRLTFSFDTAYPIITIMGTIDAIKILQDKMYGDKDVRLTLYSIGSNRSIISQILMELVYIGDNSIIPFRNHKSINRDQFTPKVYEATLIPKKALSSASSYVNVILEHSSIRDAIKELCNNAKLELEEIGSNMIQNTVYDQIHIPHLTVPLALEHLHQLKGVVNGILKWFISYDGKLLITDASKLYKQWSKPMILHFPSRNEPHLGKLGLDTISQQQKYLIGQDIEVLNSIQTTGTILRKKHIVCNLPDDDLYTRKEYDLTDLISQYGIGTIPPQFNSAINNTVTVNWSTSHSDIDVITAIATEAIKSYIIKVHPLNISYLEPFLFNSNSYSFIANITTNVPDYVNITGQYFINSTDLSFVKYQEGHWDCDVGLVLQRTSPSKI